MNYQPIDKQINARADLGIVALMGDENKPIQKYEIILVRSDHIIVRAIGARRSTVPFKVQLPLVWSPEGHIVDGAKFKFLKKEGAAAEEPKAKAKKAGPKREGPTKLDTCREIWKANPNLTRTDMIAKFMSDGQCTKMGANTYYLLIKKEMEGK